MAHRKEGLIQAELKEAVIYCLTFYIWKNIDLPKGQNIIAWRASSSATSSTWDNF